MQNVVTYGTMLTCRNKKVEQEIKWYNEISNAV